MSHSAVVVPPLRLDGSDSRRLRGYGLAPVCDDAESAADTLADAMVSTASNDSLITVVARRGEPGWWRREGPAILTEATAVSAGTVASKTITVVLLPAVSAVLSGPVAVLSPAGAVSAYEIHVGAALAAHAGLRVEHINGRGVAGSVLHNGLPARTAARTAVPEWRERAEPRPEESLYRLASRPSLIVLPVPPGSAAAATVVADHPDADVVLIFDAVHARHGAALAQQIASMVELALGVELCLSSNGTNTASNEEAQSAGTHFEKDSVTQSDTPAASDALAPVRASDVIHVCLTDTTLELTNRTSQRIRFRVGLGSAEATERIRAVFEMLVAPGGAHIEPTGSVPEITDLASPKAVLRHWSHGSAEVYEGGERRILHVEIAVLDDSGAEHATRMYNAPNGLDFSVTARDLSTLIGRTSTVTVLPEPAPARTHAVPVRDMLAALRSALDTGASVLGKEPR